MDKPDIYIAKTSEAKYPDSPFDPPKIYPEFKNRNLIDHVDYSNEIYSAVREIIYNLGFDQNNYGDKNWNPFKNFIFPGEKVLLKPNFVKGNHPLGIDGVLSMITHASIMRPIIDYILLATENKCDIIIADVPLQSSSWQDIIMKSGTLSLIQHYQSLKIDIKLLDLRKEIALFNNENVITKKHQNPIRNDEQYITVDLGSDSALANISKYSKKLEITDYGYGTVPKHHNGQVNEYLIPIEILEADCIINLPKMKTHRKAGITCAMKNLIGINGDKSWIAHHRRGLKKNGGDEFENFILPVVFRERVWNFLKTNKPGILLATFLKKIFRLLLWKGKSYEEKSVTIESKHYREGSWHGNDTIWRCIRDLNQILFYADKSGSMTSKIQRKYLCIVDGIVSGEKEGPMEHLPKKTSLLIGGKNPLEVDFSIAEIMGFDYLKIPSIANSFNLTKYSITPKSPAEIKIISNCNYEDFHFKFLTPSGWKTIFDTFKNTN